jgi:hypothetical protein
MALVDLCGKRFKRLMMTDKWETRSLFFQRKRIHLSTDCEWAFPLEEAIGETFCENWTSETAQRLEAFIDGFKEGNLLFALKFFEIS